MKKLGIVGGASWNSTALYYDHINRAVARQLGGMHSARLLIESFDFADYASFHAADDWQGANAMVLDACKRLADGGADGLLLASNTMHKAAPLSSFYREIKSWRCCAFSFQAERTRLSSRIKSNAISIV